MLLCARIVNDVAKGRVEPGVKWLWRKRATQLARSRITERSSHAIGHVEGVKGAEGVE